MLVKELKFKLHELRIPWPLPEARVSFIFPNILKTATPEFLFQFGEHPGVTGSRCGLNWTDWIGVASGLELPHQLQIVQQLREGIPDGPYPKIC